MHYIHNCIETMQWNLSIAATLGEQHFGRHIGVAFIEGLFCTQLNCSFWDLGAWTLYRSWPIIIQGWPLREVPLYEYGSCMAAE